MLDKHSLSSSPCGNGGGARTGSPTGQHLQVAPMFVRRQPLEASQALDSSSLLLHSVGVASSSLASRCSRGVDDGVGMLLERLLDPRARLKVVVAAVAVEES